MRGKVSNIHLFIAIRNLNIAMKGIYKVSEYHLTFSCQEFLAKKASGQSPGGDGITRYGGRTTPGMKN
jgi:hypothetical protein